MDDILKETAIKNSKITWEEFLSKFFDEKTKKGGS